MGRIGRFNGFAQCNRFLHCNRVQFRWYPAHCVPRLNQNIFKEVVRTRGQVKLAIRVTDDAEYDDASITPSTTRPPARSSTSPRGRGLPAGLAAPRRRRRRLDALRHRPWPLARSLPGRMAALQPHFARIARLDGGSDPVHRPIPFGRAAVD